LTASSLFDRKGPESEDSLPFHQAIDVDHRQQAKSQELRAATSVDLWQQQDEDAEARDLLAPFYGGFTEGLDTVNLQEARALLEELAG
jgi:predicted ATPase